MRIKKDQIKTLGVIAVMMTAYTLLIHLPGQRQQTALRGEVDQMQQEVDGLAELDLEALRRRADTTRAALTQDERTLPGEHGVFLVLDGVSGSLAAQGITDHQLMQGDPMRFADYAVQPAQLEFRGAFTDAFAALQAIEQMDHPVRIDRLELIGEAEDTGGQVLAVVQLSTFYATGGHHE